MKEDKGLLDNCSQPSTIACSGRQGTESPAIWSVETQLKGRYTSPICQARLSQCRPILVVTLPSRRGQSPIAVDEQDTA